MRCNNCGRLSPGNINVCRFCGCVFDETKPAEEIVPNYHLGYEIDEPAPAPVKGYVKTGWFYIIGAALVIALVVVLIVRAASGGGYAGAAKAYAKAYYGGDLYSTMDASSVDLAKVYQNQNTGGSQFGDFGSLFGFDDFFGDFGGFGDLFGGTGGYESYDALLAAYAQNFDAIRQQRMTDFGKNFKVQVRVKKVQPLDDAQLSVVQTGYINACGTVLRDGEKDQPVLVYADVRVHGAADAHQMASFYVMKIDGKPYVLTDQSLNPYTVG